MPVRTGFNLFERDVIIYISIYYPGLPVLRIFKKKIHLKLNILQSSIKNTKIQLMNLFKIFGTAETRVQPTNELLTLEQRLSEARNFNSMDTSAINLDIEIKNLSMEFLK